MVDIRTLNKGDILLSNKKGNKFIVQSYDKEKELLFVKFVPVNNPENIINGGLLSFGQGFFNRYDKNYGLSIING